MILVVINSEYKYTETLGKNFIHGFRQRLQQANTNLRPTALKR